MTVKVYLKDGRTFVYGETAVFEDAEAGWIVLSAGTVSGNRKNLRWPESEQYTVHDESHIAYSWRNVEKIEVYKGK